MPDNAREIAPPVTFDDPYAHVRQEGDFTIHVMPADGPDWTSVQPPKESVIDPLEKYQDLIPSSQELPPALPL